MLLPPHRPDLTTSDRRMLPRVGPPELAGLYVFDLVFGYLAKDLHGRRGWMNL